MKYISVIIAIFSFISYAFAQNKQGHTWIVQNTDPIFMKWGLNNPVITKKTKTHAAELSAQGAVISDANGNLKYYANGCAIMDKNGDFLPNGKEINNGPIYKSYCWGYYPANDNIVLLPMPDDTSRYFAFHNSIEDVFYIIGDTAAVSFPSLYFQYSEIDSKLNNGLGDVVKKNQLVFQDTIMTMGIHACRHANGKDWWIIAVEQLTMGFQRVLLTSKGVQYVGEQRLKSKLDFADTGIGQAGFSNDGTKYAFGAPHDGVYIFDFDRCTGLFSNPRTISRTIPRPPCTGLAFSPNSQFLYVTERNRILQYDLIATDLEKSRIVIDTFDGTQSPTDASFYTCKVAPNGKIYIATTNSNYMMHIVHKPNLKGKACDFRQHDLKLPELAYVAMPNIPNFELGASDPNCKTPIIATQEVLLEIPKAKVYPNPTSGNITVLYKDEIDVNYTFDLFDTQGKPVFSQQLQNGKTSLELPTYLPQGIYFWRVLNDMKLMQSGKLVLMK
jgi:hypothetical protein